MLTERSVTGPSTHQRPKFPWPTGLRSTSPLLTTPALSPVARSLTGGGSFTGCADLGAP